MSVVRRLIVQSEVLRGPILPVGTIYLTWQSTKSVWRWTESAVSIRRIAPGLLLSPFTPLNLFRHDSASIFGPANGATRPI